MANLWRDLGLAWTQSYTYHGMDTLVWARRPTCIDYLGRPTSRIVMSQAAGGRLDGLRVSSLGVGRELGRVGGLLCALAAAATAASLAPDNHFAYHVSALCLCQLLH